MQRYANSSDAYRRFSPRRGVHGRPSRGDTHNTEAPLSKQQLPCTHVSPLLPTHVPPATPQAWGIAAVATEADPPPKPLLPVDFAVPPPTPPPPPLTVHVASNLATVLSIKLSESNGAGRGKDDARSQKIRGGGNCVPLG